jgi:hypothetical protein
MPRQFGGKTLLGKELNGIGSKQEGLFMGKITYRTGRIVAFGTIKEGKLVDATDPKEDGLYKFKVKLLSGKTTGFLQYSGSVNDLTSRYGHPSNFLNKHCQIVWEGNSPNRAKIISIVDSSMSPLESGAANQLQIKGAAFAPPGSGMI